VRKVDVESLKKLAKAMGVDYYLVKAKSKLIEEIQSECKKRSISQRGLAKMVPGLTHDRVSKIFNGQIGHMTLDKLVEILGVLGVQTEFSFQRVA